MRFSYLYMNVENGTDLLSHIQDTYVMFYNVCSFMSEFLPWFVFQNFNLAGNPGLPLS